MTEVGGQQVTPTSSATGAEIASRIAGQAIRGVASRLITVSSAVVRSDYAPPRETLIALDTAPDIPVTGRSVAGPMPLGARVSVLLYPPRGILILGALDDLPIGPSTTFHVFPTPGTFSLTTANVGDATDLIVEVWGGGGGAGGSAVTAVGTSSVGGSGGGGGYAKTLVSVAALILPLQVTVGTGGLPGGAGGVGFVGGTSQVVDNNGAGSILCQALGGGPGAAGVAAAALGAAVSQSAGGLGLVGDELIHGGWSNPGMRIAATITQASAGGNSPRGGAGAFGLASTFAGRNGIDPGGGASGGVSHASAAGQDGGTGGVGRVVVTAVYKNTRI